MKTKQNGNKTKTKQGGTQAISRDQNITETLLTWSRKQQPSSHSEHSSIHSIAWHGNAPGTLAASGTQKKKKN